MPPFPPLRFGFATRLALLYVALFALMGVQLPFFPLWLKAKGLDAGMIGLVLAVPMVVRVLAIPIVARQADRRDAVRAALMVTAAASVAGYLLVAFAEGAWAILAAYALASLAFTPVGPLTETYALKGLGQRGRTYGPVRLWGSAAFIFGSFATGFAADAMAPRYLIWLIVAGAVVMALATVPLEPLTTPRPAADAPAAPRRPLLRDVVFLAVLAAGSLIQASHAVYYGFSALAWRKAGPRRQRHRRAVGARRDRGDRAVRAAKPVAARLDADRAHHDRRWRRRLALDGDGVRSAGRRAAVPAIAARGFVRRHPSRRAHLHFAPRAARAGGERARLLRHRARRGDGGGHGAVGLAVRRLRQRRLWRHGASGDRWRRLRNSSADGATCTGAVSAHGGGCGRRPAGSSG